MGVYGAQHLTAGALLDEACPIDSQPHLRDPYTYSKIAQESICLEAQNVSNMGIVIVRPGVLYGPGRPLLCARVGLMFGNILIRMGGRQTVPYSFVENCADAVACAAEVDEIGGLAFNIVDDNLPSASEILRIHRRRIARIRAVPIPGAAIAPIAWMSEWYSKRTQGMFPPVLTRYKASAMWKPLQYSNDLAKTKLRWRPRLRFDEGVEKTLLALRDSGARSRR
jgi:nucleoside-diphosphate-sugar epimerase